LPYIRADAWPSSFNGLIAAAATPMRVDRSVDLARVPAYADFLLEHGADGLMVAGTTGEFVALDLDERSLLVARFVESVAGRVPVIAHIGHIRLEAAQRLAERAARDGADALAAIVPYFHHVSQSAVVEHLLTLARTCPELPFFIYNYPDATGNRLSLESFETLLELPNIHGIKASVGSWDELEPFIGCGSEVLVVCGNDSLMDRFVRAGGRAIVSGNAAALPDMVRAAFTEFSRGDPDGRGTALVASIVSLTLAGSSDRLKGLLELRGASVGPARVQTHTPADLIGEDSAQLLKGLSLLG